MNPIKVALYTLIVLFITISGYPQALKFTKSELALAIEQVINDYPNHFKNLLGEPLVQNPQRAEYGSTVCLKGTHQCIVIKHSSGKKEVYS